MLALIDIHLFVIHAGFKRTFHVLRTEIAFPLAIWFGVIAEFD